MKTLAYIGLFSLVVISDIAGMDKDTKCCSSFGLNKKDFKGFIKGSGMGVKEGCVIIDEDESICYTKNEVRQHRSNLANDLMKNIDSCLQDNNEESCGQALNTLARIKRRYDKPSTLSLLSLFSGSKQYKVSKIYDISDLVKNKLNASVQDQDMGECLKGKEYSLRCRIAKQLIRKFKDNYRNSKELSFKYKQAILKIKEYKKTVPVLPIIKEVK